MMHFHTIFLDMDGVFANFHLEAVRAHLRVGRRLPHIHSGEPASLTFDHLCKIWPKGASLHQFLCPKVENAYDFWSEEMQAEFWPPIRIDPMFWRKIAPLPWLKQLFDLCHQHAEHVCISTTPDRHPYSYAGKFQWLMDNHLDHYELQTGKHKWRLADPRSILIDDSAQNCQSYCKEVDRRYEKPGSAILFPAVWNANHQYYRDPLSFVRKAIEVILTKQD